MILEEAYMRNPKPDKQARLDVVQRVSLNEKEVQVRQLAIHHAHACSTPAFDAKPYLHKLSTF
jgi:hypothetical protein